MGQQDLLGHHLPLFAQRTGSGIDAGEPIQKVLPDRFLLMCPVTPGTQDLPGLEQPCFSVTIAQDAIVPDLDESIGKNMLQKPLNEPKGRQDHPLGFVPIRGVSIAEGDLIAF